MTSVTKGTRWVALLAVVVTAAFGWAPANDPAAIVIQVNGDVAVQRSGQSARTPATVGLTLLAGDRVMVPGGAKAVLLHRTGRMETVTADATVVEPATREPAGLFAQTVRTLTQVATTDARTQPNRQGMIRPIAGAAAPILPRNGLTVLELRPTFTWYRLPDATGYTVQLRLVDGPCEGGAPESRPELCRPVRYDAAQDTSWTVPRHASPLIPGALYEWTVGTAGGRPAPVQRFRVATPEAYTAVAGVLRELAAAGMDPGGDGLFLAALAYRDAGLFYEASGALDRLASAGAGSGAAFHHLRGEVYDALGLLDEADAAFKLAGGE
jgi:hypothetical protein